MRIIHLVQSWKKRNKIILLAVLVVVVFLVFTKIVSGSKQGKKYWFDDHSYHFEVMRALAYAPFKAADINEALTAVSNVTEGDLESWYNAWFNMAEIVEKKGVSYRNNAAKASAFLRAANYCRTAEFFLHGSDPRRKETNRKRVMYFERGMDLMGVQRDYFKAPYEGKQMNDFYFHAEGALDASRPLVVILNGFDGMYEEQYYMVGQEATKRGYNVLIYEGPGQGASILEQGLTFTLEWHKPNSAVLDTFIEQYGKPDKIALVGISLGAWLGMESIMFGKRFDAFIADDVLYSFRDTSFGQVPGIVKWAFKQNYRGMVNLMIGLAAKSDLLVDWRVNQMMWVMGAEDAMGALQRVFPFHFTDEMLSKVTADVLLMQGQADHMLMTTDQMGRTMRGLKNARSIEKLVFKNGEGGEEHCHVGALLQTQASILDWIDSKFNDSFSRNKAKASNRYWKIPMSKS